MRCCEWAQLYVALCCAVLFLLCICSSDRAMLLRMPGCIFVPESACAAAAAAAAAAVLLLPHCLYARLLGWLVGWSVDRSVDRSDG